MTSLNNSVNLQVVQDDPGADGGTGESLGESSSLTHWGAVTRGRILRYVVVPALILTVLSVCVRHFDLDLRVSRVFYDADAGEFPGLHDVVWVTLYRYGPLPGLALGIGALVALAASFVWRALSYYRRACVFLVLLLAIGPGLLVNGILKPVWDRPRPCELCEFGGSEAFVPVLDLCIIGEHKSKSFPSGHASIGFYLLSPFFVLRQRSRGWAMTFLVLGILFGAAMGWGRVAQGRHFPSDVLWSAAIVYFLGLLLAYVVRPATNLMPSQGSSGQDTDWTRSVLRLDEYRESVDEQDESPQRRAA
ncbi:MAG TPA: phosphatase PAP2 family protein [Pirellulaceae bacterium]|nr:phosphatase PAP2 family protein [Pirellulaceae bacterium]